MGREYPQEIARPTLVESPKPRRYHWQLDPTNTKARPGTDEDKRFRSWAENRRLARQQYDFGEVAWRILSWQQIALQKELGWDRVGGPYAFETPWHATTDILAPSHGDVWAIAAADPPLFFNSGRIALLENPLYYDFMSRDELYSRAIYAEPLNLQARSLSYQGSIPDRMKIAVRLWDRWKDSDFWNHFHPINVDLYNMLGKAREAMLGEADHLIASGNDRLLWAAHGLNSGYLGVPDKIIAGGINLMPLTIPGIVENYRIACKGWNDAVNLLTVVRQCLMGIWESELPQYEHPYITRREQVGGRGGKRKPLPRPKKH